MRTQNRTDEKRYELVCGMIRTQAFHEFKDEGESFANEVIGNPRKWENSDYFPFYADAAKLLNEAMQNMDRKTTGASRMAAINRLFKSCKSGPSTKNNQNFHGAFQSGGKWAICDGYRFVRLNRKPESVPEVAGGIDLDRLIPKNAKDSGTVKLPSPAELKAVIADIKAKHGRKVSKWKPYEAFPGWWCNPQYLLDLVQALPGCTAYLPASPLAPLYCESEDGDGMILPVRPPKREQAEDAA